MCVCVCVCVEPEGQRNERQLESDADSLVSGWPAPLHARMGCVRIDVGV